MGTNYYANTNKGECECCGRAGREIHLGKTSAGWPPLLRLYNEEELHVTTLDEWLQLVTDDATTLIRDEYGRHFSAGEFLQRIYAALAAAESPGVMIIGERLELGFRGYCGEFS